MPEGSKFLVRKVAVLGAGVMGAQIAAHMANASVDVTLFELAAEGGDKNANSVAAIDKLKKQKPAPAALESRLDYIHPANYEQHLERLRDCDLVIEAIAERPDLKRDLYQRVAPTIGENAVFASNTSGLSINDLGEALPEALRRRFCGVHFFNPPRYMHLVELIPHRQTDPELLDELEAFLTTALGKGVVRAKDTTNFVGNRIGVFAMLAAIHHTQQYELGFDVVDALTGPAIGRPKSATYRTADVVGLDTFAHVAHTMDETLTDDPWHAHFQIPGWLQSLIDKGALGAKSGAGVYRKQGKEIQVLDLEQQDYRPSRQEAAPEVAEILKLSDFGDKLDKLRTSDHPQAQFLWALFRDTFHYCAYHLADIADNARDLDFAIRWGFGWQMGPFETWQAAGWARVASWISEDIEAGKAMSDAPLPEWARDPQRRGVHDDRGSYSPAADTYRPRSDLPVYRRQLFPELLLGETRERGTTIFETDDVRLWHTGDDIAILSFKSKAHSIGQGVLEGINRAVDEAEARYRALVIWQDKEPFSVGANLAEFAPALQAGQFDAFEQAVAKFQRTTARVRYAMVPVVAAVSGMALGGGCELSMHCSHTVAALESYMGFVEAGVGLVPAGGGLKELARRAQEKASYANEKDVFQFIRRYFETVAQAKVASSAYEAQAFGFLRPADTVVFNKYELLYVAKVQANALSESAYRPPLPAQAITVAGKTGIATLRAMLVNMREGHFISEHDERIAAHIATVLCGGEVEAGSRVDEDWLLQLERRAFVDLGQTQKTQARIEQMLKTKKPLRN